jgi:isopentenyldiphosphate isomerase
MTAGTEEVDVVDDDDRVVRVVSRAEMRTARLQHRCVFIVVRRPTGEVLVHQRSPHKDIWPSAWDIAAGGVVHSGEAWHDAAMRELHEEVGIAGAPLRFVRSGRYCDDVVRELARVYTTIWDGPIAFNDGEVVEARWLLPPALAALAGRELLCPDSLALAGDLVI